MSSTELDPYRLPTTVAPRRYVLELAPDLDAATFEGTVVIEVEVREPVDEIVLNALELQLDDAWLEPAGGGRIDATATLDEATERAHLALAATAPAGEATLHIRFRGVLNDKLNGFYRSTFTGEDGETKVIATTQMEATFARKAFPCWDEPEAKATFVVSLVVPDHLTALSNGPEIGREPLGDGRVRVRFAETMKMSTYLVAFVVGPLELTDPVDGAGTPVRVACPVGKRHLASYALDVAAAALRYFTDYYGLPYADQKIDLIAVPDFAFGAMENTGCITFREVLLLVDPARATTQELMNATDVINHELAHMWFGNLVTMRWWEGIWLNEAFATFMETKATEHYKPEWNRWVEFGLSRSMALETDALDATRPIEFPVVSPEDAEGMFDILTYEKGGSVLRMLEQYLGEDRFRDGIRHYLSTYAYGNTETTDLWDAIEASLAASGSPEPVRRIMDSWIFQGGHPVVEVEQTGPTTLRLRQQRFRLSAAVDPEGPTDDDAEGLGETWSVPVVMRVVVDGAERVERVLLEEPELDIDLGGEVGRVVLNAGGHGFYRVRYSPALRARLVEGGIAGLEVLERYGLLDDTLASVRAGAEPAAAFIELLRAYGDEPDVAVWKLVRDGVEEIERVLPEAAAAELQRTVRALAAPALRRLGLQPAGGEDDRTRELRGVLLTLAALSGGDEEAVAEARRLRDAVLAGDDVDPALEATATRIVAETGDAADFDTALERYRNAPNPQVEVRELYNLARFRQDELIDRLCELCLTEIRSQNAPFVVRLMLQNRHQGRRAWGWLRRHWAEVNERYPSNSIVRMVEGITALTDGDVAADVQAFFAEHHVPQGAKQLAQHLERQRVAVALREREAGSAAR